MQNSVRSLVRQAIRESNLPRLKKFQLLVAMAVRPEVRDEVEAYVMSEIQATFGVTVKDANAQIDLGDISEIIQLILELLPQIIAIFDRLFG